MSAVMTSLSMPSLGTKYSFVRAEAACARLSRSRSLSLPDMMRKADENCCKKKERKPRHKDGWDAGHAHHVSLGRRGWVAQDRGSAWEEKAWKRSNVLTGAAGEPREEIVQEALAGLSNYPATVSPNGTAAERTGVCSELALLMMGEEER
jgi:hypothetical protein